MSHAPSKFRIIFVLTAPHPAEAQSKKLPETIRITEGLITEKACEPRTNLQRSSNWDLTKAFFNRSHAVKVQAELDSWKRIVNQLLKNSHAVGVETDAFKHRLLKDFFKHHLSTGLNALCYSSLCNYFPVANLPETRHMFLHSYGKEFKLTGNNEQFYL